MTKFNRIILSTVALTFAAAASSHAQAIMVDAGRARRTSREAHQRASHPYVLRGRLYCGYCGRRMQGQYSNHAPYYRCRYPATTPWPATSATPATFTSAKPTCCPPSTPGWWSSSPRTGSSRHPEMQEAQDPGPHTTPPARPGEDTQALIADCDARLAATRLPLTPEPTRRPWPSGPARSRPSAAPRSPVTPARTATPPSASSPKTTSAPSSPV